MRIAVIGLEKSKKKILNTEEQSSFHWLQHFLKTNTVTFTLTGLSADQVFLFKHILIFNIVS